MRHNWIEHCLKSLQQSTIPITPIIVDNGSTDETCAYIRHHFPESVCLPQGKNLGFGQANNVGLRYALEHNVDFILLLNQDATISSDAIVRMLPYCDDSSLLSPIHLNKDGSFLDAGCKYALYHCDTMMFDDMLINKQVKDIYDNPKLPAACWFMSTGVIKKIGGFNPLFFHYGEDDNYLQRLDYHRITLKLCTSAFMRHDRETHGNIQMFNKHLCRRLLLTAALDINHSFKQCVLEMGRILKNCYMTLLPRKQYQIGDFFLSTIWLIKQSSRIKESRKKEKNIGLTWLSLTK